MRDEDFFRKCLLRWSKAQDFWKEDEGGESEDVEEAREI